MALPISGVTHVDSAAVIASKTPVATPPTTSDQKSTQSRASAQASTPKDTVHISGAAQSALQEATETAVQTAKEARGGDRQAMRLMAREAAAKRPDAKTHSSRLK
jgi:hypothetical protein